ncbi:tyrosine-type recombinase/integrase [Saccharopolyspora erythraea]|uniref:tyrosine-type recombinase/integrase n=1 Tax=Saccharopolyspora erythraea TaxID=1836 RepID=UPI001BA56FD8|nr:site-specific integrase [Saccharopolyspora erythraea]QUH05023.1 tyrosine-type recombinase/integrase [Saccharopolyspora erythraea]
MAWIEQHGAGWRVRYHRPDGTIASEAGYTHPDHARDRAADIEYETRQGTFTDPRKAQTTFGEWTEIWSDAHDVAESTWAKYRAHLRNHILPRFADSPLADISHIKVKQWAKGLRRRLGDPTVADIVTILSMILAEAVDEDYIGKNPCRRLRLNLEPSAPKETATASVVRRVADRCDPAYRTLIITAAYTGMRWGELAGLQWHNVTLDGTATITIDKDKGALHEIGGRLELGPPKTPASARTLHLPAFLVTLLLEHAARQFHDHVFTGGNDGLLRRANFRGRIWLPAVAGHKRRGWAPIQPGLTFHGLRHTHKTWLNEDHVDRALQHQRLGHRMPGVEGIYSHVTQPMIDHLTTALDHRWRRSADSQR